MTHASSRKHSKDRSNEQNCAENDMIRFDMPSCGGCSTCELACSFHHKGEFDPKASSLKIIAKENGPGYYISLTDESGRESMACDGCQDREIPLCMEYCKEIDDLGKILNEFEQKRNKKQEK